MIEKIKALVREKDTCVPATVSDDSPHCSLMSYVSEPDMKIIAVLCRPFSLPEGNRDSSLVAAG